MSKGVDYSKWDNLEDSDDEEDSPPAKSPKRKKDEMEVENDDDDEMEDSDDEDEDEDMEDDELSAEERKELAEGKKAEGNAHFKKKDYAKAILCYTQAIEISPSHVYYSNRAACHISRKKWKDAERDARQCIRLDGTFPKGYLHLAKAQANQGSFQACTATIRQGLDRCSSEHEKKFMTLAQEIQKTFKKARPASSPTSSSSSNASRSAPPPRAPPTQSKAAASGPSADAPPEERAEWLKEQGNTEYKKGNYGTALDLYKQAVEIAPHVGKLYGNQAACETMLNKHKQAAETCQTGLEKEPGMVKLRTRWSTALLHQGKVDEALACLQEGLGGASAADKRTLMDKAEEVRGVKSKWDGAKKDLEKKNFGAALTSLKQVEKHVTACEAMWLQTAECCIGTRDFSEAGKITQKAINENRRCIDAYVLRAEALYYLGKGSEAQAVNHLQAALRMDPDHKAAAKRYKQMRNIIREKERLQAEAKKAVGCGKHAEAVALCDEALKLDPADHALLAKLHVRKAEAQIGVGKAHRSAGREDQAMRAFKDSMRSASSANYYKEDMMQGYLWKVKSLQLQGDYQKAVEELEDLARGAGRGDPSVKQHLKHAKFELKKSKRKDYYALLGIKPNASAKDVKVGYRKSAMKWHPDRHSMASEEQQKLAEQRFKDIGEANDVLSDASMKRLYDQGYDYQEIKERMDMQEQYGQRGGFGGHGGFGGGFGGFGGF